MLKRFTLITLLLSFFILPGCVDIENIFGSNSGKQVIALNSDSETRALATRLAREFVKNNENIELLLTASDSATAYKLIAGKKSDISLVSEQPDSVLRGVTETMIASDCTVIIANAGMPVENITRDNLIKVLSGEINNWKDIDGPDAPISVVVPISGYASRRMIEDSLLIPSDKTIPSYVQEHQMEESVKQAVASNVYALGFIPLNFADESVKTLKVDGFAPTADNIRSQRYILAKSINCITFGDPKGAVKQFIDFTASDAGKTAVSRYYTPVN